MAARTSRTGDQALQGRMIKAWLRSHASPHTVTAYRHDLETFGSWCAREGSIALRADTATIVAFQAAREAAGDSASTLRRRWSALSSFYDYAIQHDAAQTNPVRGAVRPRVAPRDPSPTAQLSARAVKDYRAVAESLDPRLDVLVSLLVSDGFKVGEALALDVGDVVRRGPKTTITLRRRGTAKQVTLDPDSARAVRRCIGRRCSGPLLTSGRAAVGDESRRLTRFGADHLIRQLTAGTGRRVTANELRRFHITEGQTNDTDLDRVRDRAGLADVRSVRRYLDVPQSQLHD